MSGTCEVLFLVGSSILQENGEIWRVEKGAKQGGSAQVHKIRTFREIPHQNVHTKISLQRNPPIYTVFKLPPQGLVFSQKTRFSLPPPICRFYGLACYERDSHIKLAVLGACSAMSHRHVRD